jgi:hypothetical protein
MRLLEHRRGETIEPFGTLGEAPQSIVVIDHGLTVAAELHIDFDAKASLHRCLNRACGVFDQAAGGIMQTAMRNRPRGQPT